jgi:hypothetical protein
VSFVLLVLHSLLETRSFGTVSPNITLKVWFLVRKNNAASYIYTVFDPLYEGTSSIQISLQRSTVHRV